MGVWIRRLIIIACVIALIPNIFSFFSGLTNELPSIFKVKLITGMQYLLI